MCHKTTAVEIDGDAIEVDSCVSDIVEALNRGGIETYSSCCGHDRATGTIHLLDGRSLLVVPRSVLHKMRGNHVIVLDKPLSMSG